MPIILAPGESKNSVRYLDSHTHTHNLKTINFADRFHNVAQAGLELEDNLSEAGITGVGYHAQLPVGFFLICYTLCACKCMCVPQCEYRAQRVTCGSQVSFYHVGSRD